MAVVTTQCHQQNSAFVDASKMVASAALRLAGAAEEAAHAETGPYRDVCRHWAKGYCALGESCAFPHVGPSPAPAGGGAVVVNGMAADAIPSPAELREQDMFVVVKSSVPCKDYQAAKCHRGDKCKFAHVGGPPRRAVSCRDWQQGRCTRGDACRYRHARSYPGGDDYDDDDDVMDGQQQQEADPVSAPYAAGVTRVTYVRSAPGAPQQQLAGGAAQPVQRIVRYYTSAAPVCSYASPTAASVMPPLCDYSSPPAAPPAAYPAFYPSDCGSPHDMVGYPDGSPHDAPGCGWAEGWDAPAPAPQLLPPPHTQPQQGLCTPPLLPQPHPASLPAGCEPLPPSAPPPQVLLVNGVPQLPAAAVQLCCEAEAEAEDLRRRVDEMEAHAASLRAQAEAAEQHAAVLRSDRELRVQGAAPPAFGVRGDGDGGSQSDRPESDDTRPTSPRRSFSYATPSDRPDGGMSDASDRASTPPASAEQYAAAAYSRRTSELSEGSHGVVMRHDPYAC